MNEKELFTLECVCDADLCNGACSQMQASAFAVCHCLSPHPLVGFREYFCGVTICSIVSNLCGRILLGQ